MVDTHFTLRGQIGGNRAEVRLEPGHIRVQALTIVTQQPAIDATFSYRELVDLRIIRRTQWTYVIVPLMFGGLIAWSRSGATGSMNDATWVFIVSLVLAFGLVTWLLPRTILHIAAQGSVVEMDISLLSRKRARELVAAVVRERPDLAVSTSGPTRG